jgi:hypothetical protein
MTPSLIQPISADVKDLADHYTGKKKLTLRTYTVVTHAPSVRRPRRKAKSETGLISCGYS